MRRTAECSWPLHRGQPRSCPPNTPGDAANTAVGAGVRARSVTGEKDVNARRGLVESISSGRSSTIRLPGERVSAISSPRGFPRSMCAMHTLTSCEPRKTTARSARCIARCASAGVHPAHLRLWRRAQGQHPAGARHRTCRSSRATSQTRQFTWWRFAAPAAGVTSPRATGWGRTFSVPGGSVAQSERGLKHVATRSHDTFMQAIRPSTSNSSARPSVHDPHCGSPA